MRKSLAICVTLIVISTFFFGANIAWTNDKIEHKTVIVASTNDEWTSTKLRIMEGDIIVIIAAGTVRVGEWTGDVDADGASNGDGALYGKIGVGAGFLVGAKNVWVSDNEGTLKLKIRDGVYSDNSGNFEVRVIRIPPEAIPDSEIVEAD